LCGSGTGLIAFLRAAVGGKLHAPWLVDYTNAEPLAEFVEALAWQLFLLVFLIVFAHRFKALSASNFSRTAASTYSLWLIAAASAHLLTLSMVSGMSL
jgi:hypothetical protein